MTLLSQEFQPAVGEKQKNKHKTLHFLLTDKQTWDGFLKVNQTRYLINAVFFGFVRVVDLDEYDALSTPSTNRKIVNH